MRRILSLIFVCLFCLLFCGCKEIKFDENCGQLVVGLECDYAPFNWTETIKTDTNVPIYGENGVYADGYDVQIAKLIAKELDKELVIKKISFNGLVNSLNSGNIDLIIAGMSPTEERKVSINFTSNYYVSDHVILVKKDSIYANAVKFSDFKNAYVVGQKGTIYADLATQMKEKGGANTQNPIDTVPLIVAGILSGTYDATIVERPVALSICNTNPSLVYIKLNEAFDVEEVDTYVAIGVRKVDTSLLERCNNALQKITYEQRDEIMLWATSKGTE